MTTTERRPGPRTPPADGRTGVMIVGAGPVGMALACALLQQDVPVRVIDKVPDLRRTDPHSRAVLVVPRVLEALRPIGVSEGLVAAGHPLRGIGYYSEGRHLGTVGAAHRDTPYPFVLALPQRETEAVLRGRLAELGGSVEHGVTLERLDQGPDEVTVLLRHADGHAESVAVPWLVGADGSASATRRLLGGSLRGDATDVTYLICDAPLDGPVPDDAQYYYSRHGIVAVIPLGGGSYRVAINIAHRAPGAPEPDWQAVLQEAVDRRTGRPFTVGVPSYARVVRPRCGTTDTYGIGRVFLAGDAAHVITPAGGQGMNLGLLDAVNLGWRLGGVVRGRLDPGVLDPYTVERKGAAVRMARTTARVIGFAQWRSPVKVALRDTVFRVAHRMGVATRVLGPLLTQLDADYGDPAGGRGRVRAGQRLPLFDGLAGGYTVLAWPGRRTPAGWAARTAALRHDLPDGTEVLDGATVTDQRPLRRALGGRAAVAAVRPDGHVAAVAPLHQSDRVLRIVRVAGRVRSPAGSP